MRIRFLQFGLLIFLAIGSVVFTLVDAKTTTGLPIRIIIPRIHVDSVVEEVTTSFTGSIASPRFALNAGWFSPGVRPGDVGSAVIAGDVRWRYGATALFSDLHFLKPGDMISVKNDTGVVSSFVVRDIKSYDIDADIEEVFKSDDKKSHLNLVTVDGMWDKDSKRYSRRLVVFADAVIF